MENDLSTAILSSFIKELDVPVTRQSIKDELEKHPHYDSLLGYSDLLNNWRIPNAAYQLGIDQLADAPVPFIASTQTGEFVIVNNVEETHVTISNEKYSRKRMSLMKFEALYSGAVLVAEKDDHSGEPNYVQKRQRELIENLRMPFFFAAVLALLLTFLFTHKIYISTINIPIALLILIKTAGFITSILLLIQGIDAANPIIQKICSSSGDSSDCNAILKSKAANINDYLSWSEVGFFYFAGTWLILLFNSSHLSTLHILAILNIVSLPYTFYSIYYQWRVAKKWCILCCTIQALLWLEFFPLLAYKFYEITPLTVNELSNIITGLAIPILTWILIKPYLMRVKQSVKSNGELRRFKYDSSVFERILSNQVKYALPLDTDSLIIGNREAANIITMVSNPYCEPCAEAHKTLHDWLDIRDDIKLQIVFATPDYKEDNEPDVAEHLMSLRNNNDHKVTEKALSDWYEQKQKGYDSWSRQYPKFDGGLAVEALNIQREWCKMTESWSTPTLFINGRRLPSNYEPGDIKYFI
ncbi:vitamin K epoxide reductase family protein [Mucilaginibacter galii]|uniref:Peptidase C39 domain-containing protein n=1 Tax=Mucilaginibacter galii TaxID=2005073 RepID=A0A917N4L9_9SPHI|nr:vitamin K epoxide reductase family protein [Mucilaginibacter galii]GGI52267.1 hypothetical protein GCM10011425_34790 [Mucilaginibacter galii]